MPSFKLVYPDGSSAASTKVRISFDGGGTADAISDGRGMVTVSGSNTRGKVLPRDVRSIMAI